MDTVYGAEVNGDIEYVDVFAIIAVFVLLIACVNFINLTTARAVERAKEIGVRKCSGALKGQLIVQFLMESLIGVLIAWLLALLLCFFFLPLFNNVAGKVISPGIFNNVFYPLQLLALAVLMGLLAGIYPAFVLSSFRPADVLKGQFKSGSRGILLRKALVIGQFSISIMLIVGTIVVYSQLSFMRKRSLGFDKDNILVIANNGNSRAPAFKQEISDIAAIQGVTNSSAIPGRDYNNGNDMSWVQIRNGAGELQKINVDIYNVDEDFLNVYQIKLTAGTNFQRDEHGDSTIGVILNEAAVKELKYTSDEQAIGKQFESGGFSGEVIGVVRDFHYHSLKEPIAPMCLLTGRGYWYYTSIKVAGADLPETVSSIRDKWEEAIPSLPFNYFFLDEDFDRQYYAEDRFGHIFFYFSILAILISAFGLLGLASCNTIQRTREIGIRKVMGASTVGIVGLLSADFLKLVVISFVIACPVSWYVMYKWLSGFADPWRV